MPQLGRKFLPHGGGGDQAIQKLHRYKQRIVPSSELVKPAPQFLVRQLPALRALQQLLRFRYSGVPLIHASLSAFGPSNVCRSGHTPSGPECGSLFPSLLTVSACLPARTLQLTGNDVVAVAGVVPGGQQEVPPAVVALPGRRRRWSSALAARNTSSSSP